MDDPAAISIDWLRQHEPAQNEQLAAIVQKKIEDIQKSVGAREPLPLSPCTTTLPMTVISTWQTSKERVSGQHVQQVMEWLTASTFDASRGRPVVYRIPGAEPRYAIIEHHTLFLSLRFHALALASADESYRKLILEFPVEIKQVSEPGEIAVQMIGEGKGTIF